MTIADWWSFVRTHGILFKEITALGLGIFFIIASGYLAWDVPHIPKSKLTYRDIISPIISFGVGISCLFIIVWGVRERYLLQPGRGRYTVATVYEHYTQRGKNRYACEFFINGQRWQTGKRCGTSDGPDWPCPSTGQRVYLYFSPEDPRANEILPAPVPDTLRTIPPLGWARLP